MPEWTGDNVVIKIDDNGTVVEVQARWKSVKLENSPDDVEVTRGANRGFKQFRPGIREISLEMTLGIDAASILPDELHADKIYNIDLYPNGEVAGEPMHQQEFYIKTHPLEISTGPGERVYQLTWKQANDPTVDFFTGGVVPA